MVSSELRSMFKIHELCSELVSLGVVDEDERMDIHSSLSVFGKMEWDVSNVPPLVDNPNRGEVYDMIIQIVEQLKIVVSDGTIQVSNFFNFAMVLRSISERYELPLSFNMNTYLDFFEQVSPLA